MLAARMSEPASSYFAFRPKLLDCLPGYTRALFGADLAAGVTVGIVALPLAMAFAIASGVPPQAGIFTAVIAGFLISALGGTRVCIGGVPDAMDLVTGRPPYGGPEMSLYSAALAVWFLFLNPSTRLLGRR